MFCLFNDKISGGHDRILLEDIFSILDIDNIDPINREMGVEWLTRHACEDIGLFATAYFYMYRQTLRIEDVEKIMAVILPPQQTNPYYKLISDFYQHDRRIQPGKTLPAYTLISSSGDKLFRQASGHPQIIFSVSYTHLTLPTTSRV